MYEKIDSISSNIGLCSCFDRMIPTKSKLLSLQEVPKKLFIKRILSIPMRKSPR